MFGNQSFAARRQAFCKKGPVQAPKPEMDVNPDQRLGLVRGRMFCLCVFKNPSVGGGGEGSALAPG